MKVNCRVIGGACVAALLLACASAARVDGRQYSLAVEQAAKDAQSVLVAKAITVTARRDVNIYTFVDFETVQSIKGSTPPRFTYRMLGGRVDDVEVSSDPPMPKFVPGQQYVLFLGPISAQGYPTLYTGNVYNVFTTAGVTYVSLMDTEQPTRRTGAVPLTDFLAAVRKAQ